MKKDKISFPIEIRPVCQDGLGAVLYVDQQYEDFLPLGSVATTSIRMVLDDLKISEGPRHLICKKNS